MAATDPSVFVQLAQTAMTAARQAPTPQGQGAGCTALIADAFDIPALARGVAGPHWDSLKPDEVTALGAAIARRLVGECIALLARPAPGAAAIKRVRTTDSGVRVTTLASDAKGNDHASIWALRPGGPWGFRAIDLIVDGTSTVQTLGQDLDAALTARPGDTSAAIASLAARGAW